MRAIIDLRSIVGVVIVISLFTACSGAGSKTMPPVGSTADSVHNGPSGGDLLDTITKGFENGNYPIGVAVAHPGPL